MKKILLSLSVIAFVAAIGIYSTVAYFSDTETSTGNTFTAGSIDLKIDSECSYNDMVCVVDPDDSSRKVWAHVDSNGVIIARTVTNLECNCDWDLKDLTPDTITPGSPDVLVKGDRFFDFSDIKPGDWGENTISFHGASNDAHLYGKLITILDDDVDCVEPEIDAEVAMSLVCAPGNDGELDENIYFFIWEDNGILCGDTAGDNIYDPLCEEVLIKGYANTANASSILNQRLYLGELPAGDTSYIGVAWCVGNMTVDPSTGAMTCDGSSVGNEAQTDTLVIGVEFESVQTRHNPQP